MSVALILFLLLVFIAAFLLVQGLAVPAFGESARTRRLLKERLVDIEKESGAGSFVSLLRQKYLDELTPRQRSLETLPGMEQLRQMIDQAGRTMPAHQLVLQSLLVGAVVAVLVFVWQQQWLLLLPAFALGFAVPILRMHLARRARLDLIERELPDAIDVIRRALKAGQPFPMALKLVGEDMDGPIAEEFAVTSADLNYGNDPRRALLGLLSRVPSVALMGFVTAVLLQRETGGNLAEVLAQISGVIRGRYRFQRRVRTLSAEGRMSAWVLSSVPVLLGLVLHLVSPGYLAPLFETPRGQNFLLFAALMMTLGILWIRKIIRIEF